MFPIILLVFALLSLIGFYISYLYGRKTKRFKWREYFALLSVPVACSLALAYFLGIKIIYMFLASAVIGFILEYGLGMGYHKTLNGRLWKYDKFSLNGYTSWLTIPMWGVAGIIFYLVSKSVGL